MLLVGLVNVRFSWFWQRIITYWVRVLFYWQVAFSSCCCLIRKVRAARWLTKGYQENEGKNDGKYKKIIRHWNPPEANTNEEKPLTNSCERLMVKPGLVRKKIDRIGYVSLSILTGETTLFQAINQNVGALQVHFPIYGRSYFEAKQHPYRSVFDLDPGR